MSRRRLLRQLVATWVAFAVCGIQTAGAQPLDVRLVELDPPTTLSEWFVRILPLTVSSALVLAAGPPLPGQISPSSELLLIEELDGTPRIQRLPLRSGNLFYVDHALSRSKRLIRLSATRALLAHPGADGVWDSGDEGAYLIDDLGGANRITSIPLGRVRIPQLARLDHETALAAVDDQSHGLVLLSRLGRADQATGLIGLRSSVTPLVLDSRRFVAELPSGGLAVVRVDPPGVAEVQPIETEFGVVPLQTLVLSPRRLLLSSVGYIPRNWRDNLQYVVELGSSIEVKPISTPNVPAAESIQMTAGFPRRARLSATRAVLLGVGEGNDYLEDDEVLVLDDLASTPRVTVIHPGRILRIQAPVALGEDGVAVRVGTYESDSLVLIRDLGTHPSITMVPLEDVVTTPFWLAPATLMVPTEGATPGETPEDEAVAMIRPFEDAPAIESQIVPFVHQGSSGEWSGTFGEWPVPLGNGRVLFPAADEFPALPGPGQGLQILEGFAGDVRLETERVDLEVRPGRTSRALAVARFSLPDPARFAAADLEVRLGDAIQMLPADSIVATPDGFLYSDPAGSAGFFRRVEYRTSEGQLIVDGRGAWATPARRKPTRARNLILSLESTELYVAQSLRAKRVGNRIQYRAP